MKIISLSQYPDFKPDIEFKESVPARLIAAIVAEIACLVLFWATHFPIHGVRFPKWWCYPASAFFELISILAFLSFRKSLRPTNWLLRSSGNRLWIKFRSFLNDHLPADEPQIIELGQDDVAWVGAVTIRLTYVVPGGEGDGTTRQRMKYLDIGLKVDTAELGAQLQIEARHPSAGKYGFRAKFNSYQVSLPEPRVIRLCWSANSLSIRPGLDEAIAFFSRWTRIRDAKAIEMDYSPKSLAELSDTQQRGSLRDLKLINPFSASYAVRKLKNCSLAEARQYLKQL